MMSLCERETVEILCMVGLLHSRVKDHRRTADAATVKGVGRNRESIRQKSVVEIGSRRELGKVDRLEGARIRKATMRGTA